MRLAYRIGVIASALIQPVMQPESRTAGPERLSCFVCQADRSCKREGELDILSATPQRKASGVIAAFRRLYPTIKINFVEMSAQQVYDTVRRQSAVGHGSADLVWSAGMDLQIKLVNDALTQRYVSPERRPHFPRWANWKNQAWAVTAEPVVFIYNRALISDTEVPKDHAQLRTFLESHPAPTRLRLASYSVAHLPWVISIFRKTSRSAMIFGASSRLWRKRRRFLSECRRHCRSHFRWPSIPRL